MVRQHFYHNIYMNKICIESYSLEECTNTMCLPDERCVEFESGESIISIMILILKN